MGVGGVGGGGIGGGGVGGVGAGWCRVGEVRVRVRDSSRWMLGVEDVAMVVVVVVVVVVSGDVMGWWRQTWTGWADCDG